MTAQGKELFSSKEFKPKYLYDLLRIGKNNDGGYLVESNSIQTAKSLISFGIGYDWSFEVQLKKIKNIPITCK